ncbi:MAG: sulfatase-like hydrolase/transferase [Akkermansiaceae bacterium]|jgi:arylsulfatase A-like enzyme|nr:sulfatase-like hydrolase/transferase [Akkermansiaceae bacterium]MDP4646986.1 sulfatase-like hydrolase/transferase [Akkermansiaceae bacterium]MDP4722632.1 sulfatase-like hydrolase/transferase [Akkermansiaceae bacterium]MDP4780217.1 sulfatase-like hydrolase/transferase [Akkermansiaceae bacterium]MDP4847534.1 sulfatase-like hydrolase/transferase [Akkermansiaceae bacterium]
MKFHFITRSLISSFLIPLSFGLLHAAESEKPNIILIISDDQGFPDYGFMGHESIKTPHLDQMAADSLLYTRGYVMPVCSPSLACLLTGLPPHKNGITGNDLSVKTNNRSALANQLLDHAPLLPQAITDAGYLTFQTGKLWNATYKDVGFSDGMTDSAGRHGDAGLTIGREGMQPIYDFIGKAQEAQKPFFIWHAPFLPHTPHNPPEEIFKKYQGKGPTPAAEKYYAMVEWFDQTCGELDDYLTNNNLSENTVILYLADNGWDAAYAHEHDRAKLSPYELGIRTPMFVRWPGKVEPKRDEETLASILDFAPTILQLAGAEMQGKMPGLNLLNREAMTARKAIFIEAYTHDIADLKDPAKSLIAQVVISDWSKLLIPGPATPDRPFSGVPKSLELFDLKTDPLEKNNLASERPDEVKRLQVLQDAEWSVK